MHSKKDNIEIMMNDEVDKVIKEPFDSLKNIYNLELMSLSLIMLNYCISLV